VSVPETHDLAGIVILEGLNEDQLRDFEKSCRWRRFAPDEQIVDQQSDSNDVYFITRGRVRVVNFTYSGKEVALEDLTAGQYFGELAAIDGRPRSSSVVALEDSDIAKMSPERFVAVMKMYPDVGLKVMRNMAGIIRTATERIVDLSTLGANSRASTTRETVARVLSDLAKKGIVKREKDSLVVCDVMALENMVDEVRG
jgi:CRP/FNR family transcriptional regulator, cyclic AMP receptor protein